LKQRLEQIRLRIRQAAESCNRDADSVRLVAVSKTIAADIIKDAIEAGVTILGENYVQEARDKFKALAQYPVSWHFIGPTDEAHRLIAEISRLKNIAVKGLMTMPPYFYQPQKVQPFFAALRELRDQISEQSLPNVSLDELSMGMTGDFEVAIKEGATLVRIGTAIFGERQ
jgi:uncharacterized pyridoxal phosphate-containing UPF0001 family protein